MPIDSALSISWFVGEIVLAKPARFLRGVSARFGVFRDTMLPNFSAAAAFTAKGHFTKYPKTMLKFFQPDERLDRNLLILSLIHI